MAGEDSEITYLVYDGDCPFCSAYVNFVRVRESIGTFILVNARDGGSIVDDVISKGLDLDEGMVLVMDGQYYYADDCINRLALLSTSSGIFNRLNAFIFRSPTISSILYPVLRFGRNILLRLLGRKKITPGQP
jgi:predicted DCC family thiol-disulfide oxidoreductase YuxK